jgi:prepilin-type N-terminal cleavage/methylation domain-containing protein
MQRAQRGFSMIEVMIGIVILASVIAYSLMQNKQAEDQAAGRAKADSLASFQQMAAQYFVANRTQIEAAMGGDATQAATYCQINVPSGGGAGTVATNATKHTCAFDATQLAALNLWPGGTPVNASSSGRYVAIVRQVLNGGTATGADEMLIVMAPLSGGNVMTTGSVTFTGDIGQTTNELKAHLDALGGTAGYVPPGQDLGNCKYNGTTKQVCGNGWTVTLSDFIN